MKNPPLRERRPMRLSGYDYSRPGAYFVTVCTQNRVPLFGSCANGTVELNPAGQMLEKWWEKISAKFGHVRPGEHIVMPNHLHGIIWIDAAEPSEEAHAAVSLPAVMKWFKTMTTNEYLRGVKQGLYPAIAGRLWQHSYYEHIVRDEEDLRNIREYIVNNALKWPQDEYFS